MKFSRPEISKPAFSLTRRRALALGAAGLMLSSRYAAAQTRLQITEGNFQPIPIAIPKFIAGTPGDGDTANGVTQIVTANLQRSGLFTPIDPAAYTDVPSWCAMKSQEFVYAQDLPRGWALFIRRTL